jgi:hypothetical protein
MLTSKPNRENSLNRCRKMAHLPGKCHVAPALPDFLNSLAVRVYITSVPTYPAFATPGRIDVRQGVDRMASAFFPMIGGWPVFAGLSPSKIGVIGVSAEKANLHGMAWLGLPRIARSKVASSCAGTLPDNRVTITQNRAHGE